MSTVNVSPQAVAVGAAVLVLGFIAYKAAKAVPAMAGAVVDTAAGVLTGNNAVTQGATNAAGEPVTAYQGAGILGTLGAATNAVSGGWFATMGENIGGWIYDATNK